MAKWEYKQQTSEFSLTDKDFINWFNEEGQQGWEIVDYTLHSSLIGRFDYKCTAIFKRKIEE